MARTAERTLYREVTPWPGWVALCFWGSIAAVGGAVLAAPDTPWPAKLIVLVAAAGSAALVHTAFAGLTVRVRETHVLVHLGRVALVRRRIPYDEIVSLTPVRYRPIRDFGGWGVRGTRRRRVWSARGDRAVELELTGERRLLIGSDHPQRLEERIRAAAGERLRRR